MKKMKKLLAVLMTFAMVMAMGITSFAEITGSTIKVEGLSTAASQEVKIYEIYRLDENNNLWVLSDWAKEAEDEEGNLIIQTEQDLASPEKMKELAKKVPTTADAVVTTTTGEVEIKATKDGNQLQAGAYLVLATDSLNKTKYNPMVAVTYKYDEEGENSTHLLIATNAKVTAKASEYDIDKTIINDEDKVYEVGDLVTYEVKTTVPYLAKGETVRQFIITDKLTNATYFLNGTTDKGEVAKSEVTIGGSSVEGIAIPETAHNQSTFTLNLTTLVVEENTYAGKEVVIRYTAKVGAADTVENKVSSTYVPNVEKGTVGFTGQATIKKYDQNKNNVLSDATFVLYRLQADGKTPEYAKLDDNNYVTGEWTTNIKDAGTVTTDANGLATIKGLDVGTYYFKETIAPDGYKVNAEPYDVVKVVVTKKEANQVVTVAGDAEMQNSKLATLPSTGGIGTTIFTIGGCGIMIAAAYLFFVSRRKEA